MPLWPALTETPAVNHQQESGPVVLCLRYGQVDGSSGGFSIPAAQLLSKPAFLMKLPQTSLPFSSVMLSLLFAGCVLQGPPALLSQWNRL